jgi:quinol monooxygenase YgiN
MYQLMKSDKTPLFYNIIERYADKERDYLGTHRNTPQFQEFRATLKEMQEEGKVILSGESYIDLS